MINVINEFIKERLKLFRERFGEKAHEKVGETYIAKVIDDNFELWLESFLEQALIDQEAALLAEFEKIIGEDELEKTPETPEDGFNNAWKIARNSIRDELRAKLARMKEEK